MIEDDPATTKTRVQLFRDLVTKPIEKESQEKSDQTQRTKICLVAPALGNSKKPSSIEDQVLFEIMLPSFINSLSESDLVKYEYNVFVGFDQDDVFFDNPNNFLILQEYVEALESDLPLTIHFIRITQPDLIKHPARIWTGLANMGYHEGCDYFYQVNDDLNFITRNWTDRFISILTSNPLIPNFGMVSPIDIKDPSMATQAFVHKTHLEIMGHFYPFLFRNSYCDNWLQLSYSAYDSHFVVKNVAVENARRPTRYTPIKSVFARINLELKRSCGAIFDFLSSSSTVDLSQFLSEENKDQTTSFEDERQREMLQIIYGEDKQKETKIKTKKDQFLCPQIHAEFMTWAWKSSFKQHKKPFGDLDELDLERTSDLVESSFESWKQREKIRESIQQAIKKVMKYKPTRKPTLASPNQKGTILILLVEEDSVEETKHWLGSASDQGMEKYLLITLDSQSFYQLQEKRYHVFFDPLNGEEKQEKEIRKWTVLLDALHSGFDVLLIGNKHLLDIKKIEDLKGKNDLVISRGERNSQLSDSFVLFKHDIKLLNLIADTITVVKNSALSPILAFDLLIQRIFQTRLNIRFLSFEEVSHSLILDEIPKNVHECADQQVARADGEWVHKNEEE